MDSESTLEVLRAAYRLDVDEEAWVDGVARALAPKLDEGLGVQTFVCDFRPGRALVRRERLDGGRPEWAAVWRKNWWEPHIAALPPEALSALVAFSPVSHATDVWRAVGRGLPTYGAYLRELARHGWSGALADVVGERPRDGDCLFYPDSLNLVALDPSGLGLVVVANRERPACPETTSRALEEHGRLCAHLTAALRLRRGLGRTGTSGHEASASASEVIAGAEAVFAPSGRVLHAAGAAVARRDELAEAVRRRDTARREGDLLSGWRALHEGRWSLLDVRDSGDASVVVATPNAPETSGVLERLSERERQVLALLALGRSNKAIAYELGIATSTVATLLSRARWKLGAQSVAELVVMARRAYEVP